MRILLTTDSVGGVWTFSRELTLQLLAQGHSVALVTLGREPSHAQQSWCAQTCAAWPHTFLCESSTVPLEWMSDNRASYRDGAAVLMSVARRFQPDILHSGQYCYGRLPLDMPRVITAHSDVMSWAAACRPGGLEPSPWLDRYHALVEQGLRAADAVIAPTRWMLDALTRNFPLHAHATVIPNGRSLAAPRQKTPRRMQAISVGRLWDEGKGLATLLSIDSPIPILVAGEESFGTETVKPHELSALGVVAEDELLQVFGESSIYLATSIYEPFGLAPLEAALCGCAVIARDLPSFRQVWREGATYFRNASHLEQLLHTFAAEPRTLAAAQFAAAARAAKLTSARMAAGYVALYSRLLQTEVAQGATAADAA